MSGLKSLVKTSPDGWMTSSKERKSYYLYFAGQNMIYSLVTSFLTTYLLFLGVDPTKSGVVMIIVKIWDAVNDTIFGVIFDKVKFKSGKKFIPWLKISTALIPVTTIMLFVIPSTGGENFYLAWLAVAYILWDTAYTLCDVPIYGVITSMTDNMGERTSMLSYKSIWAGLGTAITTIIATVLVGEYVKSNYSVAAVVVSVIAFAVMIPVVFNVKERFKSEDEEDFTLRRMFSYLFKNKYLLIYYLGFFFYSSANVANSLTLFASYYLFHNSQFSLIVQACNLLPQAIFAFLVPQMVKRWDKMKIFKISNLLIIVTSVIIWLCGYNSIVLYLIFTSLRSIPLGIVGIIMFMFTPDCAEYGQYKTGIEAKGITFAIQTFMAKLTGAIQAALPLFILGLESSEWVTYSAENFDELNKMGATQTGHALDVLWFTFIMLPAIGCALAAVVWRFYKLNDKDVQLMAKCNYGEISKSEAEKELSISY